MKMNQKGTIPILFLIGAIGLITFIIVSNFLGFKDKLFSQLYPKPASEAATPVRAITIKDMLGANVVVNDDPNGIVQTSSWVRDYHKWYWYEPKDDVYTWGSGWQKLDTFYGTLKSLGVKVMADVEYSAYWASSNGLITGIPNAAKHAEYLGALAKHYGNTIAAIENYNEPNQWWEQPTFKANEFGQMTLLDYNAVKAANPATLFVHAGLAGTDTNYLASAKQYSQNKYDVLNFHWYANRKNPEAGGLIGEIRKMKGWRDANVSEKPIWITEFGWDTSKGPNGQILSKYYAPEENAANYLVRAILMMHANGIEKGFVFNYRDAMKITDVNNLGKDFNSSGLVENNNEKDGRKKVGWYYLATLKNILGDYIFNETKAAGQGVKDGGEVYHYEYIKPGTNSRAAVLWARKGDRDNGYTTPYSQAPSGTLVSLDNDSTKGSSSSSSGTITLSEKPVILLYEQGIPTTPSPTPTPTKSGPTPTLIPTSSPTPLPTVTPIAGIDLLTSGGFETGNTDWYIPSWYANVLTVDSILPYTGTNSLHVEGKSNGVYTYQDIAVSAGKTVNLSGFINIPQLASGMSVIVDIQPLNQYNGNIGNSIIVANFNTVTDNWVSFSKSATMPDNTVKARIRVRIPVVNGKAFLDNLTLTSN